MPDNQSIATAASEDTLKTMALVGYVLMVASLFTGGLTVIAGLILAYLKRDDAGSTWLRSHFAWQIGANWGCILLGALGLLTAPLFGLGFVILVVSSIWYVYRIVRGLTRLSERRDVRA